MRRNRSWCRRLHFSSSVLIPGLRLLLQWYARDLTRDPPTAYLNAFITIDENAFPREAQLDSDDPFRRGWQVGGWWVVAGQQCGGGGGVAWRDQRVVCMGGDACWAASGRWAAHMERQSVRVRCGGLG